MEQRLIVDFGFQFGEQNFERLLSRMKVGNEAQRRAFLELAQSSIGLMQQVDMGPGADVMKRRNLKMLNAANAFLEELESSHAEDVADIGGARLQELIRLVKLVRRAAWQREEELKKGGRPLTRGFYILERLAWDFREAFKRDPSAASSGYFFAIASEIKNLYPDLDLPVNAGSIKKILEIHRVEICELPQDTKTIEI